MKTQKSENTKQLIIEKTATVFNVKGYAGTSINDVMSATGLSKGCIYGNFENKDEIALNVFDYNFARVTEHMKERILATEDAIERLLVYPQTYKNYFRYPYLQAGCPILNTATEADDTHPLLRARAQKALDLWKTSIENQIKRGIERNEIKADTDPAEIAVVMISIIEGAFMQAKVNNRMTELNIAMSFLEKLIRNLKA
ncbi:DNA-binding transcriptional regulator, AcrR family [Chryseobacterium taichungense]|uniref:DNA-binding transcriptional regulator, AcrR family n=1 Tax=Chryseobacterium taichungense TaxID=295069 RepID=A0A1H7Y9X1_9FLAO|nr:TetR/AcrR family transcriptional regulator [Chryseobacterium taichungense]SEM42783.1 DNA-binding transcriptional regulator, AcrR family [Chryseobacterium taichungense]